MTHCLDDIRKRGTIRIGISGDSDIQILDGLEVDLAHLIAEELFGNKNKVELVKLKLRGGDERVSAILENRVDLVIALLTITEERLAQIDFSTPYFLDKGSLLVFKGGPIKRFADLKGKKIAIAGKRAILKPLQTNHPEIEVELVDSVLAGIQALREHKVVAFAAQHRMLACRAETQPDKDLFTIIGAENLLANTPYGIGMRKGCSDLVTFVNSCLSKFKMNGSIKELFNKYGL